MEYHFAGDLSTMCNCCRQSLTTLASLQPMLILPLQNSAGKKIVLKHNFMIGI